MIYMYKGLKKMSSANVVVAEQSVKSRVLKTHFAKYNYIYTNAGNKTEALLFVFLLRCLVYGFMCITVVIRSGLPFRITAKPKCTGKTYQPHKLICVKLAAVINNCSTKICHLHMLKCSYMYLIYV